MLQTTKVLITVVAFLQYKDSSIEVENVDICHFIDSDCTKIFK